MDFEKLKSQVKELNDTVDGKNLELRLLEAELIDINKPCDQIAQTNSLLFDMLMEINEFIRVKGKSEKSQKSFDRIMKLMQLNEGLSKIAEDNYRLKLFINEYQTNYTLLRVQNMEMRKTIKKITDAENL